MSSVGGHGNVWKEISTGEMCYERNMPTEGISRDPNIVVVAAGFIRRVRQGVGPRTGAVQTPMA